ncbi:Protein of unknown function [Pyronema omphalodes CBS 100304]|uniref:Uncharacterized protein n=1 Tax=Pyronema omphalodes (strain CBS 100304) TaxID=1076935 RepID=U4KWD8_PYROM|nr:Protein of unknown function [Pyronema omphalodes CBS 100304]
MIAGNMRNVLEVAIKYVGAIGTFNQHNPEESSLVLGGFMVILKLGLELGRCFEEFQGILDRIHNHLLYLPMFAKILH